MTMRARENMQAWLELLELVDKKGKTKEEKKKLKKLRIMFCGKFETIPPSQWRNLPPKPTAYKNTRHEVEALNHNSKVIKSYLEENGISMRELADISEVSKENISNWVRCAGLPMSDIRIEKINQVIGIKLISAATVRRLVENDKTTK